MTHEQRQKYLQLLELHKSRPDPEELATDLLGGSEPEAQHRLLAILMGEIEEGERLPLSERDVIKLVYYRVDHKGKWQPLGTVRKDTLPGRLRQLASDLNKRLERSPGHWRVVRPLPGWLFIWDQTDLQEFADAKSNCVEDSEEQP